MKHPKVASMLKQMLLNSQRYADMEEKFYVIAATLDKRGRIISIGENSPIKTHPLMKGYAVKANRTYKEFLHAEVSALVKSQRKAHSILVIRLNHNGELALAKPCPVCMLAIHDAEIKHVWYSTQEGTIAHFKEVA